MKFRLLRQPQHSGDVLVRFHVQSDDSIVGIISVPPSAADDLLAHWIQPQAAATTRKDAAPATAPGKKGGTFAEALASATKRPGAVAPAPAAPPNPMVGAMVRVAKKHALTPEAILRGC
jgi:hypothetical protein